MHDNQTEMDVLILEGDFNQATLCNVLGQMTISGLQKAPKGEWAVVKCKPNIFKVLGYCIDWTKFQVSVIWKSTKQVSH